jgi:hypothetical protein
MFLHHIGEFVTEEFDKVNALQLKIEETDERKMSIEMINVGDLPTLVKGDSQYVTEYLLNAIRTRFIEVNIQNSMGIGITVNRAGNIIASDTRRGAGNHIIANMKIVCEMDGNFLFNSHNIISDSTPNSDEIIVLHKTRRTEERTLGDAGLFIKQIGEDEYEVKALEKWLNYYHLVKLK